ncbi:MAG: SHOCT domain-containing protein [Dehalococcoidales bacterium]
MFHDDFGWMFFGGFWMIVFWGAIIALIVWVVIRLSRRDDTTSSSKVSALDTAKERYAKGEITKAEFDQIKKDIS